LSALFNYFHVTTIMLKLYDDTDFNLLATWVTGPEMLFQFAGTEFLYPITQSQVTAYRAKHPDRNFYIGYTPDLNPFAFGEIIPQDNNPRVGRLLIGDPDMRGKGLGVYFLKLLIGECKKSYAADRVDLYVWEKNMRAIKCYEKAGFGFVPQAPFVVVYDNPEYKLLKMTMATE
jgi:RimJ/RimL family protein N-acetyltransferase